MNTPTATIFIPFHALDDLILRGTRAAQPAASAVVPGTLYCVTDEGAKVERSSGTTWQGYSPTPGGGGAGTGDVVGPGVATDDAIALYDGTTGKLIQDSGQTISGLTTSITSSIIPVDLATETTGTLPLAALPAHATRHQPGGADAMAVDAVAATGSLRTLGTGAQQAASGTDSRFTNARTPTAHATTHQPGGADAMVVDAVAATGSLRTLGTGANQAAPGNDTRFTTLVAHHATHEPGGSDALLNAAWTNVANVFTANQTVTGTNPIFTITETDQALDGKNWQLTASSGALYILPARDNNAPVNSGFILQRNGNASIYGDFAVGTVLTVGAGATVAGSLTVSGSSVNIANGALTVNSNATIGGLLTVNGFGTHSFSASGSGVQSLMVANSSAGATNAAQFYLLNDVSALLSLRMNSSAFTTNAYQVSGGATVVTDGVGGLSVAAAHASGAIRFYTGGTTERMQVTAAGDLLIGATSVVGSAKAQVSADATVRNLLVLHNLSAGNAGNFVYFVNSALGVPGYISQTGAGSVAYNTTSDVRLKTDAGLATDLSALRAVTVHDFRWTSNGTPDRGIFAQETAPIFPRAVTVGSDGDDLSKPWGTDYSKFVADLIVGWQQHDARLTALEAKTDAE